MLKVRCDTTGIPLFCFSSRLLFAFSVKTSQIAYGMRSSLWNHFYSIKTVLNISFLSQSLIFFKATKRTKKKNNKGTSEVEYNKTCSLWKHFHGKTNIVLSTSICKDCAEFIFRCSWVRWLPKYVLFEKKLFIYKYFEVISRRRSILI